MQEGVYSTYPHVFVFRALVVIGFDIRFSLFTLETSVFVLELLVLIPKTRVFAAELLDDVEIANETATNVLVADGIEVEVQIFEKLFDVVSHPNG